MKLAVFLALLALATPALAWSPKPVFQIVFRPPSGGASGGTVSVTSLVLQDSSGVDTLTFTGGNHTATRTLTWTAETNVTDVDFSTQGARITIGSGTAFTIRNGAAGSGLVAISNANFFALPSNLPIKHSSSTDASSGSYDVSLERIAGAVYGVRNGLSGDGWIQNRAGDKRVASNVTNSTTTMSNLTDLTLNLAAGRKYSMQMNLLAGQTTSGDGAKIDFDGGNATVTAFVASCKTFQSGSTAITFSATTALATDITFATFAVFGEIQCFIDFVVNGAGTFIPRYALNSGSTGPLAVSLGSALIAKDMP